MSRPDALVRAAGCVLYRRTPDGVEIALVHRERYDDWSHSKGHVDAGEHPAQAAVREVLEETGFTVRLGRRLRSLHYEAKGRPKQVDYWAAEVAADAVFVVNEEVDELRWMPAEHARKLLSYPHDVDPLDDLLSLALPDTTVLLLRHASAGSRQRFSGDDLARPLDVEGQNQARHLTAVLPMFGATTVLSAPPVRCHQTVAHLPPPVTVLPALGDLAYEADPWALVDAVRHCSTGGGSTVLCSQGETIPASLTTLFSAAGLPVPAKVHCRKGSFWVLSFAAGRLVSADYERDALPVA